MSDPKAPNGTSRPPLFGESAADDFDFGATPALPAEGGALADDFSFDEDPAFDAPLDPTLLSDSVLLDPTSLPEGTLDTSPFEETDEAAFLAAKRATEAAAAPKALDFDDLAAFDAIVEEAPEPVAAAKPASAPPTAAAKPAALDDLDDLDAFADMEPEAIPSHPVAEAAGADAMEASAFSFDDDEPPVARAVEMPMVSGTESAETAAALADDEDDAFGDFAVADDSFEEPAAPSPVALDAEPEPKQAPEPLAAVATQADEPEDFGDDAFETASFSGDEEPTPAPLAMDEEPAVSAWSVSALDPASQSDELEAMSRRAHAAAAAYQANSDEPSLGPDIGGFDADADAAGHGGWGEETDGETIGEAESATPVEPEVRKYMFDLSFDYVEPKPPEPVVEPVPEEVVAEVEPEPEPPPPPPTFSEAELEAARQMSFDSGRAIGHADSQASLEGDRARALEALGSALPGLLAERAALVEGVSHEAARLAHAMARRLMPALAERYGLVEIEQVISSSLDKAIDQPRVIVRVAPALVETVSADIDRMATTKGFAGRIVALGDASLGPADVRIDWGDGGAERMTRRIWTEIDQVVARAVGRLQETIPEPTGGSGSHHETTRGADSLSGMGSAA